MLRPSLIAAILVWAGAGVAQGADCTAPGFAGAMERIVAYYESAPIALFNTQLQVNAVAGHQVLTPDGKWGPATAGAVCGYLETYAAINGEPPDGYIATLDDAGYFVQWIGSMARMNLNPGMYEAPD